MSHFVRSRTYFSFNLTFYFFFPNFCTPFARREMKSYNFLKINVDATLITRYVCGLHILLRMPCYQYYIFMLRIIHLLSFFLDEKLFMHLCEVFTSFSHFFIRIQKSVTRQENSYFARNYTFTLLKKFF